ncbi:hypothetical protein FEF65_10060 [Mariprofundus erugo]|uniref:Uncharacterized protein n=1 Tax=Mariprofundus erugo TaxID=2528639 RepID=A0A5R9GR60_9PROT|nr:hypothetical protein [Mariprofundus erugo]TLS66502.1 hypothetical protein FEF65_10060 [Mariprofundus erugo]
MAKRNDIRSKKAEGLTVRSSAENAVCKQSDDAMHEGYEKMTGSPFRVVSEVMIVQVAKASAQFAVNGQDHDRTEIAQRTLMQLAPNDQVEGMLFSQMIALHNMAMECACRVMHSEQTFEGRDMNMRHATRLMNAYANAVATLDKHRSKGKQKITVEHQHIQVENGGQAIVGDVHHRGRANEENE